MTLLGTLTATARQPSCSKDTKLYGIEFSPAPKNQKSYGYGLLGPTDTQACMPPGYKAGASYAFYPASVCPYGYTTGCDPVPVFNGGSG